MKNFIKNKQTNKAFTLVETLIAISIFTISVLTIMVILGQNISDTTYAKRKLIASYLAQEGIEYVRNMRDSYVSDQNSSGAIGWANFTSKLRSCNSGSVCRFNRSEDVTGNNFISKCNSSSECKLYENNSLYDYDSSSGTDSGFIREIWTSDETTDEQIKIYSKVSWVQGSGTHTIEFSEILFNWVE